MMTSSSVVCGLDTQDPVTVGIVARAIGAELELVREERGWSRGQLVARLPSGIGERTLLSYEHGQRHVTVLRLLELCRALGVTAAELLTAALQRARLELDNLALLVDLRAVVEDESTKFRPLRQWARNKLNKNKAGVAELAPAGVDELADFLGYDRQELVTYLARFLPERRPAAANTPRHSDGRPLTSVEATRPKTRRGHPPHAQDRIPPIARIEGRVMREESAAPSVASAGQCRDLSTDSRAVSTDGDVQVHHRRKEGSRGCRAATPYLPREAATCVD